MRDSFAETISISHSLQQFVSAYFCGEGRGKWTDHLFANAKHPRMKNVKAYFWRLEFQRRGTPHLHCLVWVHRVDALDLKGFSASVPQHHPVVAHNVLCHQQSSIPPRDIQISSVATHGKNGKIVYQCSDFDDKNNICSYVDTVVMSLRSHMDVHCTDGYNMLLQCISSYVTKMHDDFIRDDLYNVDMDPIHLPEKHLPEITFPEKTLGRNYIIPNIHFPERAFSRNYNSLNMHLPEITFS